MNFKLTLVIVATFIACASSLNYKCTQSDWAKFKEEYNKSYELAETDLFHYNTFCENLIIIEQNNHDFDTGEAVHKLSVNKLSDLSPPEQQEYLKAHRVQKVRGSKRTTTEAYE
ncbi:uncharacterized protein LOC129943226 [Eupeodes corollae]|uniref:uncharacterized protein LOC129943226 n=1 Tax=Eupeodes corollae TaxID=290404 RepID=UPI0024911C17|nr:uncharacterized protein LOC129943226 [Eupeodes corollae]